MIVWYEIQYLGYTIFKGLKKSGEGGGDYECVVRWQP